MYIVAILNFWRRFFIISVVAYFFNIYIFFLVGGKLAALFLSLRNNSFGSKSGLCKNIVFLQVWPQFLVICFGVPSGDGASFVNISIICGNVTAPSVSHVYVSGIEVFECNKISFRDDNYFTSYCKLIKG